MKEKEKENQEDKFIRRQNANLNLDKKREARVLTKDQRIRQIIDQAILYQNKHSLAFDEAREVNPTFDVKIKIKEYGTTKATIEKEDLDIFELKFLVENLDDINRNVDFNKIRDWIEEMEMEEETEGN